MTVNGVCDNGLRFMLSKNSRSGLYKHTAFTHRFQSDQRPLSDQFIPIVEPLFQFRTQADGRRLAPSSSFYPAHILLLICVNFRFKQRHPFQKIPAPYPAQSFLCSPYSDSLAAHFLPLRKICTVAKFCWPPLQQFRASFLTTFRTSLPSRRDKSALLRPPRRCDKIKSRPFDVCPVFKPNDSAWSYPIPPLRWFCAAAMPFRVRLAFLAVHVIKSVFAVNNTNRPGEYGQVIRGEL